MDKQNTVKIKFILLLTSNLSKKLMLIDFIDKPSRKTKKLKIITCKINLNLGLDK